MSIPLEYATQDDNGVNLFKIADGGKDLDTINASLEIEIGTH